MNELKTVSRLQKCIRANVAIYKNICGVELRVTELQIYKMSFIEVLANLRDGLFYTYATFASIDSILEAKDKMAALPPVVIPPKVATPITTPPASTMAGACQPTLQGTC